jgi:hypothetical protein
MQSNSQFISGEVSRRVDRFGRGLLLIGSISAACLLASIGQSIAQQPVIPRTSETGGADAVTEKQSSRDLPIGAHSDDEPSYHNEVAHGRVIWLASALKERFGISTVPEVAEQSLVILSSDGEVLPLVENLRGRAFRKDERLRDTEMEIWVRRYDKQPYAQILRIFELQDGKRYEVDYWCDVCAIPMYETGPCACCQDPNRLRKRLVSDADAAIDDTLAGDPN